MNNQARILEEISYMNLINFYRDELNHVLQHNQYSGKLTKYEQARFYHYGITFCKSRGNRIGGSSVMLSNKALKALEGEMPKLPIDYISKEM